MCQLYACPPISQLCPFHEIKLWNYQVSIQKTESVLDILNRKEVEPQGVREHAIGRS